MKADEQEGGKRKTGEEGAGGANKKAKIACDIVASSVIVHSALSGEIEGKCCARCERSELLMGGAVSETQKEAACD